MTVVFIKRECDRHPGCFTMTDECERCVEEDFRERVSLIFRRHTGTLTRILEAHLGR